MRNGKKKLLAMILIMGFIVSEFSGIQFVQAKETKKVYRGEGYCITVQEQSVWDNGSVAEVTIQNTGTEAIRNWSVTAGYEKGTFENVWNADVSQKESTCHFFCREFNQVIAPGEDIRFGYQMKGGDLEDLQGMSLDCKNEKMNAREDYSVSWQIVSQWDRHAVIEAELFNHTGTDIVDWQIQFAFAGEITNIWNAQILSNENGTYRIKNNDYNANVRAKGTVRFGFEAEFEDNTITCPEDVTLTSAGDETKDTPVVPTSTPETTSTPPTAEPTDEDFDPDTDVYVYHDIENKDWNREMIRADADSVKDAIAHPAGGIRVALLDSGVNYSDEVYVSARKNFVPGEDDYSELYEDGSGHGTAIAEILASNPDGTPAALEDVDDGYVELITGGTEEDMTYGDCFAETTKQLGEEDYTENSLLKLLDSGYEWNQGVNPTVDLISAKVLDENNQTTVERVISAIDWAIEQDANIISMSFGMQEDSAKLHKAIQRAYRAGVLIIASAGNGEKVEYPAAYEEVMAVGAVDSLARQAQESASGQEIEVVAPGEFIVSRGVFDSMQIFSGTSMAVPHVTGLASILWQKDTKKSADFIRRLITMTARECGDAEDYGHGLIDCEYALEKYEEFEKLYQPGGEQPEEQIENTETIDTDADVRRLYGNWKENTHEAFVSSYVDGKDGNLKIKWEKVKTLVKILKTAVRCSDNKYNLACKGMKLHPWFHGFYGENGTKDGKKTVASNYLASFYYLYRLAEGMYTDGRLHKEDTSQQKFSGYAELKNACNGINKAITNEKVGSLSWGEISSHCKSPDAKNERSLLLFGMALHTLTDTYAHSTYSGKKNNKKKKKIIWTAIGHKRLDSDGTAPRADSVKYYSKRYKNARKVASAMMSRIVVSKEDGFQGFKSSDRVLSVYAAAKYYDIEKSMTKGRKYLKSTYLKKAYAFGGAKDYAKQLNEYLQQENTMAHDSKIILLASSASMKQTLTRVSLGYVKKILNSVPTASKTAGKYTVYRLYKRPQEKTASVQATVYDEADNEVLETVTSRSGAFELCAADSSRCRVEITALDSGETRTYRIANGRAYAGSQEISAEEVEEETEDVKEDEDSQEMCDVFNIGYELKPILYRIEVSWKDSTLDLDSILAGIYNGPNPAPEMKDNLFLTCFVEKTFHPDLAEVFQWGEKAQIDEDIKDASRSEVTKLFTMKEDWLYFFWVRNYYEEKVTDEETEQKKTIEEKEKEKEEEMRLDKERIPLLSKSGAEIRLYQGNQTTPIYTAKVPETGEGYYWAALCFVGNSGKIAIINQITRDVNDILK